MLALLQFYFQLCFLKNAPQDAPFSKSMYYFGLLAYYFVGVFLTSLSQALFVAMVVSLIQTGLLVFLTNILLWVRKTPERYEQTMTALTISGAIIGIAAMPIMSMVGSLGGENIASIVWFILILWEAVVIGHIYRHAMEIAFMGGLGIAFIYMYLSFAVTLRLMKIIAAPF
ncbi:MAG TPA: hypothetical protein ENK06_05420 [Gammaproteobacteria bacterium]|nr:hypothetical protein [Gammaproteobacteria bacterium]